MYLLETQIEIHASVERVWTLLTDPPSYPRWNPFVRSIEGLLETGRTLSVFLQPPGTKGMRIRPIVRAVETLRELRWKGKLFLPGLFDGEHYFRLEAGSGGKVTFLHGELFSGILVPFLRRSLDASVKEGFLAMNTALKQEAEKR